MQKVIMGIKIGERTSDSVKVQEILTKYGCIIKTRIGVHDADDEGEKCSSKGVIILEFVYNVEEEIVKMEKELEKINSVIVKKMVL